MKRILSLLWGLVAAGAAVAGIAPPYGWTSEPMTLDIESGVREAKTVEQLAYDWSWHGDAKTNTEMKVFVQKGDAAYATTLVSGLTDVGEQPWSPTDKGQYTVTLRTYVDGYYLDTLDETAIFNVVEHIPLEVTHFTATPRYPWNGKVDVDLTFTGDNRDYAVTLWDTPPYRREPIASPGTPTPTSPPTPTSAA